MSTVLLIPTEASPCMNAADTMWNVMPFCRGLCSFSFKLMIWPSPPTGARANADGVGCSVVQCHPSIGLGDDPTAHLVGVVGRYVGAHEDYGLLQGRCYGLRRPGHPLQRLAPVNAPYQGRVVVVDTAEGL